MLIFFCFVSFVIDKICKSVLCLCIIILINCRIINIVNIIRKLNLSGLIIIGGFEG